MQGQLADGIKGGHPHRFEGPVVTQALASVGIKYPAPWCSAIVFYDHAMEETPAEPSHCPRTASALKMAAKAPAWCKLPGPQPGAVGILRHADGIHGHVVVCKVVGPLPGQVGTIEGDTNAAGSSTGDAMGEHPCWEPALGERGVLLGWFDFGLQPPSVLAKV